MKLTKLLPFFAEQLENVTTDAYHYQVFFNPGVLLPDIEYNGAKNK